jgi:LPS-assembly protein
MKFIIFYIAFIFCFYVSADTKQKNENKDVIIHADDMQNDDVNNILIAKGNVIISNGTEILEATEAVYDKKLQTFKATGDVKIFDKDRNKIFAKYAEVSDKFEFGFMQNGQITTSDKEFIAAIKARREEESIYYYQGVYSPCLVCHDSDRYNPLWQLKAERIHHDRSEQEVYYKNARLEIKGVPVFYTPYFKHPDPTVKRKTGLLSPSIRVNTDFGMVFGIPVYVVLGEYNDMTLSPYLLSKENHVLSAEYRHRFRKSFINLGGSITKIKTVTGLPEKQELRPKSYHGHYFGDFGWNINDNWRLKAFYIRATNPTYLRRYDFVGVQNYVRKNVLTSTVNTEYFNRSDYMAFKGYHFQNVRADVNDRTVPDVLPATEFSFERPTGLYNSFLTIDANTMSVRRNEGAIVNRVSGDVSWVFPYTNNMGMYFEGLTNFRADVFDINKHSVEGKSGTVNQVRGRTLPGAMLTWKWPFYSKIYASKVIWSPVINGIIQPNESGSAVIPNEDSQDFELDSQTLFKLNRFNGYDLLDSGQRLNYGMNFKISTINGVNTDILIAQSYSFNRSKDFPEDTGVREGGSDYIGKVRIVPKSYFYLDWALRLDRDSGSIKRSIVSMNIGPSKLSLGIDYIYMDHSFLAGQYGAREQILTTLRSQFTDQWFGYIEARKQIRPSSQRLEESIGIVYLDECFKISLTGVQKHYTDRDIKPEKVIMLTFGFKNLGEVSTGQI